MDIGTGERLVIISTQRDYTMSMNMARGRYLVILITLCAGSMLSFVLFDMVRGWGQRRFEAEFRELAAERASVFEDGIGDHVDLLYSLKSLYAASKEVERGEFNIFVQGLLAHHPDVIAFDWMPRLSGSERTKFEEAARAQGLSDFCIKELDSKGQMSIAARRPEYFPIYYVELFAQNRFLMGFDEASDAVRRQAMEKAGDMAKPFATGRIRLLRDPQGGFACRIFMPVYRNDAPQGTREERRQNLVGFVSVLLRVGEVYESSVASLTPRGVDAYVYDGASPSFSGFLYYHKSRLRHTKGRSAGEVIPPEEGLQFRKSFMVGGHVWTFVGVPSPELLSAHKVWQAWYLLIGGLVVTMLLGVYFEEILSRESKVRGLVDERTAELKKSTEALRRIEWLLTKSVAHENLPTLRENLYIPPYGDLSEINTDRTLLDAVGRDSLVNIATDYLHLLETSAAIYERNGDYALGIFSSGWCQFLDCASRQLCNTDDNRAALASGKWLCHESCWTEASRQAIATGQPIDIECNGGIRLYSIPVIADGEAVGSINFGYGDPPHDVAVLRNLAEKYQVSVDELVRRADAYETRPPYIIGLAKTRLHTSAKLIGEIVERSRAQRMFAEARERLAVTLNSIGDGVIATDTHGTITLLNRVAQTLTGWAEAEALGRMCEEVFHIVNEKTRERCSNPVERVLASGAIEGMGNHTVLIARDGGERILADSAAPIRDRHGSIIGVVLVFRDITEAKKAERELREALEVKSSFVSVVSHELRTPLTAIKEGIGLVIDGVAGRLNEKQKEFLGIAKRNVDRLTRLINEVLDFQKLEAGKIEFDVRENNLNETIREVCATMLPAARERGLELAIRLDEKLSKTKFDRDSIVQVLTNIIDNAIKYTERGSIIVSTIRRDNVVDVLVQDTGTGINPGDIPRLFRSFEQLTKGKYMKSGGTGLGLAISKQIIDAHRGKIWVESTPGRGSTFHFVLPMEERRG